MDNRRLYTFDCDPGATYCDANIFDLHNVDEGKPVGPLDLMHFGVDVVDRVGNRMVLKWGPWQRFTVDLSRGVVEYAWSGNGDEGRGEVACKVTK